MFRALTAAAALALALAPQARATLMLTVTDDGSLVSGTTTITPGGLSFTSAAAPGFSLIAASATGFPALPSPDLGLTSLAVHSLGGGTQIHLAGSMIYAVNAAPEDGTDRRPPDVTPLKRAAGLANKRSPSHARTMFVVTEEDEAAIRAVYEQRETTCASLPRISPVASCALRLRGSSVPLTG
jgi:hypothetical protein